MTQLFDTETYDHETKPGRHLRSIPAGTNHGTDDLAHRTTQWRAPATDTRTDTDTPTDTDAIASPSPTSLRTTDVATSAAASDPTRSYGLPATVERVVDGDTIVVAIGDRSETVRLLGIDTPEKHGGPRPGECFGAEATAFATELLPIGSQVLLSRDIESRDQYSRLLAYVHRASDGLFINLAMVQHGYATPLFFAPNDGLKETFTQAGNGARKQWIGFWPACGAADVTLQG
ncbi:Thermonuclease [Nymphon striatum]|nr:Thermonuclease [Nymphon striatum]